MRLVLALLLVLAAAGCGGDSEETSAPEPVTVTQTVTETQPPAFAEPEPPCSSSELQAVLDDQGLPAPVVEVRQRIFDAALACDYDALEQIAAQSEGFTFSFGGSTDASDYWRDVEETGAERPLPMRALATILTMPHTRNESGSYAWPTAYSESPTEEAWEALVVSGLYTQEEVDAMRSGGTGYLGYRTAITPDGDWQFFVAGD